MRLNIDKEHKELKAHGNYAFPVLVSDERLSWFDTGEFPWHWHPEIELTIVLDGNMTYLVNDNEYILRAGEGLFCNTNVLHSGKHYDAEDCSYLSITFHPRLLSGRMVDAAGIAFIFHTELAFRISTCLCFSSCCDGFRIFLRL